MDDGSYLEDKWVLSANVLLVFWCAFIHFVDVRRWQKNLKFRGKSENIQELFQDFETLARFHQSYPGKKLSLEKISCSFLSLTTQIRNVFIQGNVWEYWQKRTEKINVVIDTLLILHKSEQSGAAEVRRRQ